MNLNLGIKLAACVFLISTFDDILTNPIIYQVQDDTVGEMGKDMSEKFRLRRQDPVIQPIWTAEQGFADIFQDYNVRVTHQKLEETEAIRDSIQDTVKDGTYAVELDEGDFKEDNEEPGLEREAAADSEPEPEPEAKPEPLPEPKPEPKAEPKPEFKAETKSKPKQETKNEGASATSSKSKKSEKVSRISPFFTWLKKIFAFRSS